MSKFNGFPKAGQFWQFPVCVDNFVRDLTGAEFKTLWYILRHTYGFQKKADFISYKQIMHGIKKRDGAWQDHGTGLSRDSVSKALKSLRIRGFIRIFKKVSTRGGRFESSQYQVRIEEPPSPKNGLGDQSELFRIEEGKRG